MFEYGQPVKIKTKDGKLVKAKVLNKAEYYSHNSFWVEYEHNNSKEVSIFEATDLQTWSDYSCKCGSEAAGQSNRHAYYCDLFENY